MDAKQEVIAVLKKIPWFEKEVSAGDIEKIAAITALKPVKAGETLFREGDKEDYCYIVIEGRVGLDMFVPERGKIRFYTAEAYEIFGWSSVTPTIRQRTAGAMAAIDGLVVRIDAAKLRQLCEEDHDLGYAVMRRLANVVAARLLVTRLQLLDMFANPEAKHG